MEPQNLRTEDDPSTPPPRDGQSKLYVMRVIWMALLFAEFLYVLVTYLTVIPTEQAASETGRGTIPLVMALMALSTLGMSVVIPRTLFVTAMGSDDPESVSLDVLVARGFGPWLVRAAMIESVAIVGFLTATITKQPQKVLPFVVISVLAMITAYPSERSLRLAARSKSK